MSSAYFDASVILSVVLGQQPMLNDWETIDLGVSSEIVRVECFRTLERLHHERKLTDEALREKRMATADFLRAVDLVAVDTAVIARASKPFPAHVATLDAIHLATAILYENVLPPAAHPFFFATHDIQLARAARAVNLEVIGA